MPVCYLVRRILHYTLVLTPHLMLLLSIWCAIPPNENCVTSYEISQLHSYFIILPQMENIYGDYRIKGIIKWFSPIYSWRRMINKKLCCFFFNICKHNIRFIKTNVICCIYADSTHMQQAVLFANQGSTLMLPSAVLLAEHKQLNMSYTSQWFSDHWGSTALLYAVTTAGLQLLGPL